MSKLADQIRKASHAAPAPIGFGAAAARTPQPTLLCLVHLSSHEAGKSGEAAAKGADAVIIEGIEAGKVGDQAAKLGAAALGAHVPKATRKEVSALREAGVDFAVLDLQSALAEAMLEEKIGYVLALGKEADDTTLRLLGDLTLDALIVPATDGSLTLARLLELRRLAGLARTPLLVEVSPDASASHLQALRESGAAGVVVDASSIGRLEGLRQTIAGLPARGRRREGRMEATLPPPVVAVPSDDEQEEDE